ncbi:uncharacterized protein DEA37_0007031, partial [Paragonimus westermani]
MYNLGNNHEPKRWVTDEDGDLTRTGSNSRIEDTNTQAEVEVVITALESNEEQLLSHELPVTLTGLVSVASPLDVAPCGPKVSDVADDLLGRRCLREIARRIALRNSMSTAAINVMLTELRHLYSYLPKDARTLQDLTRTGSNSRIEDTNTQAEVEVVITALESNEEQLLSHELPVTLTGERIFRPDVTTYEFSVPKRRAYNMDVDYSPPPPPLQCMVTATVTTNPRRALRSSQTALLLTGRDSLVERPVEPQVCDIPKIPVTMEDKIDSLH